MDIGCNAGKVISDNFVKVPEFSSNIVLLVVLEDIHNQREVASQHYMLT